MFKITASGTPKAAIQQLEKQDNGDSGLSKGDNPLEQQLRSQLIGFARGVVSNYEASTPVNITGDGQAGEGRMPSVHLDIHASA
jgi:hypothetical protein